MKELASAFQLERLGRRRTRGRPRARAAQR